MSSKPYPPQSPELSAVHRAYPIRWEAFSQQKARSNSVKRTIPNIHTIHACQVSSWCASTSKRVFDLLCVIPALAVLSPLLLLVAIAVRLTSSGPVIFRQIRAGQYRKPFTIYKFRTMVENSQGLGPDHTAKGDPRITPIGEFLRRFKLDELPQLYNVLRGDMSLVGPRPKLPHHEHTAMTCRPGVTGAATLAFRDEQHILCQVATDQIEEFYVHHVVPFKIMLDSEYMQSATLLSDIGILYATVFLGGHRLNHEDLLQGALTSSQSGIVRVTLITEAAGD